MHAADWFGLTEGATLSFELFPPRNPAAREGMKATLEKLAAWRPSFVSVTYGAGGNTRDLTRDFVGELKARGAAEPVPHLTCLGHHEAEIAGMLERYAAQGVGNLLALRGDPPKTGSSAGDFARAADLVRFVRRFNEGGGHPDRRGFGIGAACFPEGHPATPNRLREMDFLKTKVDAGVDFLCTQVFFDNRDFHDFRARCELAGITVPILAGILPLPSWESLRRMAELAGGMRYPARLLRALERTAGDAEAFRRVAVHHAAEQCADLLDHGVAGLHFYTLNQAGLVSEVLEGLGRKPCVQTRPQRELTPA